MWIRDKLNNRVYAAIALFGAVLFVPMAYRTYINRTQAQETNMHIRTATARQIIFKKRLFLPATVTSRNVTDIVSQGPCYVKYIAPAGPIKKDDLVIELQPADGRTLELVSLKLKQTKDKLDSEEAAFRKAYSLEQDKEISPAQPLTGSLKNAQIEYNKALGEYNSYCDQFVVIAEEDGQVTAPEVSKGSLISQGSRACKVVYRNRPTFVECTLTQSEKYKVQIGQQATFVPHAATQTGYNGVVTAVDDVPKNGGFTASIMLDHRAQGACHPGIRGTATVVVGQIKDAITIPTIAIETQMGPPFITKVTRDQKNPNRGIAQMVPVIILEESHGYAIIQAISAITISEGDEVGLDRSLSMNHLHKQRYPVTIMDHKMEFAVKEGSSK